MAPRTIALIGLTFLAMGCVPPSVTLRQPPVGFNPGKWVLDPGETVFLAPQGDVFEASIVVLVEDGFEMQTADKEKGRISTFWRKRGSGAAQMDVELVPDDKGTRVKVQWRDYNPMAIMKTPSPVVRLVYSTFFKRVNKHLAGTGRAK